MSPQEMKAYAGQRAKFFNFILQVMAENERLRQRVEALESETRSGHDGERASGGGCPKVADATGRRPL